MTVSTAKRWACGAKTGGTVDCLDYKGSDSSSPIAADQVAWVVTDSAVATYKCRSTGATADGDSVIAPVSAALTNAGDSNLRWHKVSSSGNGGISLVTPMTSWGSSLSGTTIFHLPVGAAETATVTRLFAIKSDGTTDANFTVEAYDEGASASLASTSSLDATGHSGSLGGDVSIRVTNGTGAEVIACIGALVEVA